MPMSKADVTVWAAVFARTNYGHSMPSTHEMRQYRTAAKHGTSLAAMVNLVCGDIVENDDHYTMFANEARGWETTLSDKELDYIWNNWPSKHKVWLESEVA